MKRVYCTADVVAAGYLRGILEDHGIGCMLKNEFLTGAVGELPPTACWPEIWVRDDRDAERAGALIREYLVTEEGAATWDCPGCGERLGASFEFCWRCGGERPRDSD